MKYKDTVFGKMPENWNVSTIKEEADVVTDYVANGSFASLSENVIYRDEESDAILIRLVDYNNGFQGKFIYIDNHAYNFLSKSKLFGGEIIISNVGANVGTVFRCPKLSKKMSLGPNAIMVKFRHSDDFYYYWLKSYYGQRMLRSLVTGSAQPKFNKTNFREMSIPVPPVPIQIKIATILKSLDDKIELNNAINHNLQQQVLAMYQKMFVDSPNDNRKTCRADEYFDISIGKTPPRKEAEWFKTVQVDNIVWVSIADMGNCGLFIADSSEYLSPAAVKKFNVAIVPDNTVLLSFKLTVGRIAITDGWMTTNEAIAHFKTQNKFINEYLYCYLKSYNFQTLGSTSSIATAVNSKIIKAMPFVVPTDDELAVFHNFAAPIFEKIKACQHENVQLTRLRDSLLPKLMSGEIDVSEVKI